MRLFIISSDMPPAQLLLIGCYPGSTAISTRFLPPRLGRPTDRNPDADRYRFRYADELFPTGVSDEVVMAKVCPDGLGKGADHAVSGNVSVAIVDLLEEVDVHHCNRIDRVLLAGGSQESFGVSLEAGSREQPGQAVGFELRHRAAEVLVVVTRHREDLGNGGYRVEVGSLEEAGCAVSQEDPTEKSIVAPKRDTHPGAKALSSHHIVHDDGVCTGAQRFAGLAGVVREIADEVAGIKESPAQNAIGKDTVEVEQRLFLMIGW